MLFYIHIYTRDVFWGGWGSKKKPSKNDGFFKGIIFFISFLKLPLKKNLNPYRTIWLASIAHKRSSKNYQIK